MATFSVLARQDSITANNATLNPIGTNQAPTATLTFTDNLGGSTGDLRLDYANGGVDPDTRVIINGVSYPFTVVLTGTLPNNSQLSGAASALIGRQVMLIKVVVNGVTHEYFFVLGEPPATLAQMNAIGSGAIPLNLVDLTPCFRSGTDIATPSGTRKVEDLRAGDNVLTDDGRVVTIAWAGRSAHDADRAWLDHSVRPIRVHADSIAPGVPSRDLEVSPQHRIVIESPLCDLLFGEPRVLVAAKHLLGAFASFAEPADGVTYYHILLERHEILTANGLATESFQPARRMIEAMTAAARESLDAVLDALGTDVMLSRPDALPSLTQREASVLVAALQAAQVAPAANRTDVAGVAPLRH